MSRKLVEQRIQQSPPDLMIEVTLKEVGLLDLDQVDAALDAGKEAARQHLPELLALCDTSLPRRMGGWWKSLAQASHITFYVSYFTSKCSIKSSSHWMDQNWPRACCLTSRR